MVIVMEVAVVSAAVRTRAVGDILNICCFVVAVEDERAKLNMRSKPSAGVYI